MGWPEPLLRFRHESKYTSFYPIRTKLLASRSGRFTHGDWEIFYRVEYSFF